LLVSWDRDGRARVWDRQTGKHTGIATGRTEPMWALAWSPDGALLASGGWDRHVQLWDPSTGGLLTVLERHDDPVEALAWSPGGALLAVGRQDGTVRLWGDGEVVRLVARCLSPVMGLQFSANGRILRAADNGAATGRRPIPYLFELCNIDVGLPLVPPDSARQRAIETKRRPWWEFWRLR
jgi:WD40 repeat protein